MAEAARALGIDVERMAADYANGATWPHDSFAALQLRVRFNNAAHKMDARPRELAESIFATSSAKQAGNMTARQFATVESICREAETGESSFRRRRSNRTGGHTGNAEKEYFDAMRAEKERENSARANATADNASAATVPTPPKAPPVTSGAADLATAIAAAIQAALANSMNADAIAALVDSRIADALAGHGAGTLKVQLADTSGNVRETSGLVHKSFGDLVRIAAARKGDGKPVNIWLAGPAGSGKTHAGHALADLLGLPFYGMGAKQTGFDVLGYRDAGGAYHGTPFRQAFEHGGVLQLDELDSWDNEACMALQSAIANGFCQFPDAIVPRHADFLLIAGANTWGHGATADYVGRTKLDGAFLDRFVKLDWTYDETLESALCGNAAWAARVQRARAKASEAGLKVIISPRASIDGAALIAAGFTADRAAELTYLAALSADQRAIVGG
jgi:cobaltochelatase CobS